MVEKSIPVVSPCFPGLSLDHQTVSAVSRVRLLEREEESLSCFLRACDAALSYLQELDKVCVCGVCRFSQVCVCVVPLTIKEERVWVFALNNEI